jgi:hypothetical protein
MKPTTIHLVDSGNFKPYALVPNMGSTYASTAIDSVRENAQKYRANLQSLVGKKKPEAQKK